MHCFMPDTKNFYMAGNMGGALSIGLGVAMTQKKVIVCGGDAEFVMHMGGLTSAGRYADAIDLTYILFDNESNKSTGGQNTYQSHLNYNKLAKYCNFKTQIEIDSLLKFKQCLKNISKKCTFLHIKCSYDNEVPRPPLHDVTKNKI